MVYANDRRAQVPHLERATVTVASTFVTLFGCLVAIAFVLTPWAALFADFAMLRRGCIPVYLSRNFPPPPCVLQWNYECEKSLPSGTLSYSMNCTSSSSSGQLVGGNCSFSALSASVSEEDMIALPINASCRVADVPLPVTTPHTKKNETSLVVLSLIVFAVIALFHFYAGYLLLHRWCSCRLLPGYPHETVSRLKYRLATECFAKYFLLATLTVALILATVYYRLSCRLDDTYWFAALIFCTAAQIHTVVVIQDLNFFEKLPDSVFGSGRIDREKIKQIRVQKKNDSRRADREERQRNCTACRGNCRYCYRPLDPLPR